MARVRRHRVVPEAASGGGLAVIELVLSYSSGGASVGEEFAATRVLFRKLKERKEANRRRYEQRQRERGLCILCPTKAEPGDRWCKRCRERNKAYNKRYRPGKKA